MSAIAVAPLRVQAEDLYSKVFGSSLVETVLPFYVNGKEAGELPARVQGEKLQDLAVWALRPKLKLILREDLLDRLPEDSGEWVAPGELFYDMVYDPQNLKLELTVPAGDLRPAFASMDNDPRVLYAGEALAPAPVAGSLTGVFERVFADASLGGDSLSAYLESFVNVNSFVLEAKGRYEKHFEDSQEGKWGSAETTLTKDFVSQRTRLQAGDAFTGSFGFMGARQVSGLVLKRRFSIDPYTRPYPQGEAQVTLLSRSRVRTYINGSLIKDEIMPAGNYRLSNLPLMDGLNFVRVVVENDLGQQRVLTFSLPSSVSILRQGESDYSLAAGRPYTRSDLDRNYEQDSLVSGHYQYGVTNNYSAGAYALKENGLTLAGALQGLATKAGNFFLEAAASETENEKGSAQALGWRYQKTGTKITDGFSLNLRHEIYQNIFSRNASEPEAALSRSSQVSLSLPLLSALTMTAVAAVGEYRDPGLQARRSYNLSGNWRLNNFMNLNFYATQIHDRNGDESVSASVFFTWNIDDGILSVFRDIENDSSRLSYQSGNFNQLYRPRLNASVEKGEQGQRADLGARIPTPMADFVVRGAASENANEEQGRLAAATVATSALFAYDDRAAFAISRPGSASFALFSPGDGLKNEKIALVSTSPFADTVTPLAGDLALVNLAPYQYREVEIDPTEISPGIGLEKERFVLLPGYKSGHLVKIEDKGARSVEGRIIAKGRPLSLKVGSFGGVGFFTNREGYFYVEGVPAGENIMEIEGSRRVFDIDKSKRGIIDLGPIEVENERERD